MFGMHEIYGANQFENNWRFVEVLCHLSTYHYFRWNHTEDMHTMLYTLEKRINSRERIVNILLDDEDFDYISGHVIDGRTLFPATGYIFLIWETVGMLLGQCYNSVPVIFENVKFLRATHVPIQGGIELTLIVQNGKFRLLNNFRNLDFTRRDFVIIIMYIAGTGIFEIIEGSTAVVTGNVRVSSDPTKERLTIDYEQDDENEEEVMKTKDVYKELKLRGYQYSGLLRSIRSSCIKGKRGHISWVYNWAAFMDNMLQMHILATDTRSLYVPTGIQKMIIDPKLHAQYIENITTADIRTFPNYIYMRIT